MNMHTTAGVADYAGTTERTIQRWARSGVLIRYPHGFTDTDREVARVIGQLPADAKVRFRRRIAGVLRRQLGRHNHWDGLCLIWPAQQVHLARLVAVDMIEDFTQVGVLCVLPLPTVVDA